MQRNPHQRDPDSTHRPTHSSRQTHLHVSPPSMPAGNLRASFLPDFKSSRASLQAEEIWSGRSGRFFLQLLPFPKGKGSRELN